MKTKVIIFLFSIIYFSCKDPATEVALVGKWDFRNVFNPNNHDKNYDDEIGNKEIKDLGNVSFVGSYYVLNKDKTYSSVHTEGEGGFIEGKWDYNENDSLLSFHSNSKTQQKSYRLNYLKGNSLSLSDPFPSKVNPNDPYLKQLGDNINHRFKFIRDEHTLDSEFNFTEKKYNLWRFKSEAPENEKSIIIRVKQCLEYAVLFLQNAIEHNRKVVTLSAVNLPLNFYSNGVQMKNFSECYAWKGIFYNEEEALIGYKLIENAMKDNFEISKNENPMKLNLSILNEINKRVK